MEARAETALPAATPRTSLATWVALAVLVAVAAAVILYMGRGLTFFRDEWTFVLYRDGHDLTNFTSSYAGHLLLLPTFFFLFLFKAVGLDHYELYRLGALPLHLACALLVFLLARRRVGGVVALAPTAILLFLGSAWMDILWPFQIAFTGAIAFGLGAMLALERDDAVGDAIACACLLISVGWSGAALPFLPAVAIGLLVRRRLWRRIWVIAAPAATYLVWLAEAGDQHIDYSGNLPHVPSYVLKMAGAGITGITGLPTGLGPYLAALLGLVTAVRLWQLRRGSPLAWEALGGGLAFWLLTALARAQEYDPAATRYVYPSAVFVLLLGVGLAPAGAPRRAAAAVVLALAALTLPSNLADLQDGREGLVFTSNVTSAELGALELGRETVDPEYTPPLNDFPAVPAAAFFAVTAHYGSSPADSPAEIAASPEYARRRADAVLVDALKVRIRPVPRDARSPRRCRSLAGDGASRQFALPPAGVLIEATGSSPVQVELRRFARGFSGKAVSLGPGRVGILRPHPDAVSSRPWHARLPAASGPAAVCLRFR